MFLWETIRYHNALINETLTTTMLLREHIAKIDLEVLLSEHGILPIIHHSTYERQTRMRMHLLIYAHLVELAPVYDLMFTTIQMATGKLRLLNHETNTITAVPLGFIEGDGQEQQLWVSQRVNRLKEAARSSGFVDLADLLEYLYDNRVRNALAHAQYIIEDSDLFLTFYDRRIPVDQLIDMSMGLLALFRRFLTQLHLERETFFAGPPVKEGNCTIKPVKNDQGYQIRIEW